MLSVLVPEELMARVNCDYCRGGIGWQIFGRSSRGVRRRV
jgi:hypothetical protein